MKRDITGYGYRCQVNNPGLRALKIFASSNAILARIGGKK
jgi:hypothetical protein